jgi:hypothetical protein
MAALKSKGRERGRGQSKIHTSRPCPMTHFFQVGLTSQCFLHSPLSYESFNVLIHRWGWNPCDAVIVQRAHHRILTYWWQSLQHISFWGIFQIQTEKLSKIFISTLFWVTLNRIKHPTDIFFITKLNRTKWEKEEEANRFSSISQHYFCMWNYAIYKTCCV